METPSLLLHSKTISFGFSLTKYQKHSFRHFNKQVQCHLSSSNTNSSRHHHDLKPIKASSNSHASAYPLRSQLGRRRTIHLLPALNCSYSSTASPDYEAPLVKRFKNISFDPLKTTLSQLTPFGAVKLSVILSVSVVATKWAVNFLLNPFFWMYFSWTWLFWPWFVATALAVYGLYCFQKHLIGEASIFEQLAIVTSVFTWLTLVPPAFSNGYLEGWPFVFFFVYHYFFFFNVSVRKRLYGDYYVRPHDPKWDVNVPRWQQLLFCVGVTVGHWLAAFEGPELHLVPGGWSNAGIWVLIVVNLLMQYNSTLYLAKYSEKVVVPTAVVQFGPYRWVRHPIYVSTMLLFMTYCVALRAPLSLLFVMVVCLVYYEQKARLEEALMVETFGDKYLEYANKVRYKFIPFFY